MSIHNTILKQVARLDKDEDARLACSVALEQFHRDGLRIAMGAGTERTKMALVEDARARLLKALQGIDTRYAHKLPAEQSAGDGKRLQLANRFAVQPSPGPWRQATHDAVAGLEVGISHVLDKDGHAVGGLLIAFGPWQTDQQRVNTNLALNAPELLWRVWLAYTNMEWMLEDAEVYAPNEATKKQLTEMCKSLAMVLEKAAPGFDPTPKTEGTT